MAGILFWSPPLSLVKSQATYTQPDDLMTSFASFLSENEFLQPVFSKNWCSSINQKSNIRWGSTEQCSFRWRWRGIGGRHAVILSWNVVFYNRNFTVSFIATFYLVHETGSGDSWIISWWSFDKWPPLMTHICWSPTSSFGFVLT